MVDASQPILIVDDFATMTRILKSIVNSLGFTQVDCCQNGQMALNHLSDRTYSLIICDLEMAPMSGAEFATRARAHPYFVQCPIIIISASRGGAAQSVRDGLHEIVDGFLLKPFTASDLKTKIAEIDERRRARRRQLRS